MTEDRRIALLLQELKERGIYSDCAHPENLLSLREKQRKFYLGIDCTADSLHIGHLLPLMQAVRLVELGFKAYLLLGGATSKIGDPSDKLKERPIIEEQILLINQKKMEAQLSALVSRGEERLGDLPRLPLEKFFTSPLRERIYQALELPAAEDSGENGFLWKDYSALIWPSAINKELFQLIDNRTWLDQLTFVDFINTVGRNVTINYLLSKETIKQRVSSQNGLSFSAFTYSLLQAYDFFHLYKNYDCHGQLGSSDQWGNLTTGLKMISSYDNENKCFALTFNLIVDDNGKKISKSDGGSSIIWLSEEKSSFKQLFDYFSNMSDSRALDYVKKFTFIPLVSLERILELNKPGSLRILQRILLELFFFLIHGRQGLFWLDENSKVNQQKSQNLIT